MTTTTTTTNAHLVTLHMRVDALADRLDALHLADQAVVDVVNTTGHRLEPAKPGDAGCDLRAMEGKTLAPGERHTFSTGIRLALPTGYEAQVRPRSGLARHGVLTAFGTVDSGYRGEVMVLLMNHGDAPHTIEPGDRIAQLVVARVCPVLFVEGATLPDSARGAAGFGSTGR